MLVSSLKSPVSLSLHNKRISSLGVNIPDDIKSLVVATNGELKSLKGPDVSYSAAAGQVPNGFGGVQNSAIAPVHSAGYYGGPAYTNLVQNSRFEGGVSGSTGTAPANWTYGTAAESYTYTGTTVRLTRLTVAGRGTLQSSNITWSANTTYTLSVDLQIHELLSGGKQAQDFAQFAGVPAGASVSYFVNGVAVNATDELSVGAVALVVKMAVAATSGVGAIRIGLCLTNTGRADVTVCCPQVVASTYIFPYISSGAGATTSVVSTVGTTAGNGVSVPLTGSDAATALKQCFEGPNGNDAVGTVAALMKMGAGSAEMGATNQSAISVKSVDAIDIAYFRNTDEGSPLRSFDGTTASALTGIAWNRNEYHMKFVEFGGGKYRIGNQKYTEAGVAIDANIVWSHATLAGGAAFDGSWNPTTFLRWFLNNTVPNWMRSHFVSNQAGLGDAEIIRRLRKYGQF